jgi:phospholipase/carboxylesterase
MATGRETYRKGRLTARPETNTDEVGVLGLATVPLDSGKPVLLYIPAGYHSQKKAALALMLHGAGGTAEHGMHLLRPYADARNIILLAPASKDYSWDIIAQNSFGADVILLDRALDFVFSRYNIDSDKIAIGGFSDGASYALSIGIGNGDLFTHILAFSPGFYHTPEPTGKSAVFIAHGNADPVLPINSCSRRIVPRLRAQGLETTYHEFAGEHVIPSSIAQNAVDWWLA